jgi:hypothetical protein
MKRFMSLIEAVLTPQRPWYWIWLGTISASLTLAGWVSLWFFVPAGVLLLPVVVAVVVSALRSWRNGFQSS